MATKLFIGNLSWDTNDSKLAEFFSQAGTVVSASVITDRYSGRSKGFGFVEMSTEDEAEQAKQKLNGQELDSRQIVVSDARPQETRPERSSDYRGGDRRGGRDFRSNRRGY